MRLDAAWGVEIIDGVPAMTDPFPDEIDEALWNEAWRRADGIREFLKHRTGKMTAGNVALLATELEVSRIKLFRAGGTVMSLVERKAVDQRATGYWMTSGKRSSVRRSADTT